MPATTYSLTTSSGDITRSHQAASGGQSSGRLDSIQALRGIAASMVVFHHCAAATATYLSHSSWIESSGLGTIGAAGVDIFFVISGFIMMHTSRSKNGRAQAVKFLMKRALRIYPLYWVWTTVLLLMCLAGFALKSHVLTPEFIAASYALLPCFNGVNFHPLLDQGWTLSFELVFYLVFSCAILANLNKSRLLFLAAGIGSLFALARMSSLLGRGAESVLSNAIIFEFLFGALSAEILVWINRSKINSWKPAIAVGMTILGFFLLAVSTLHKSREPARLWEWGIPSAFIVIGAAQWEGRLNRLVVYLGNASYSIYLIHGLFTMGYAMLLKHTKHHAFAADFVTIAVTGAIVGLSSLGYPSLERRILRLAAGETSAPAC